jgi:phage FluMu gp28-like protein
MDSITETTNIYVLIDPRDNRIRYVGKANNTDVRLRNHVKEARKGKTDHKAHWLRQVLNDGFYPILEIVEVCSIDNWQDREIYWIEQMKRRGYYLTNEKDGGYGCNPSIESRARMSASAKNRPAHNKGKVTAPTVREKQSKSAIARWAAMTKEQIFEYMQPVWNNRKPVSEKTRERLREIARNRVLTKDRINKSTIANYRLTSCQVSEIRTMLSANIPQKDIANKFNVSEATISNIKRNKAYKLYE